MLDVGSGIGFWIDYYLSKGAKLIYGVDIASEAIKYLTRKYKYNDNVKLFEGDFSHLCLDKRFEIVNAFDVTYHVVDNELFKKFVENLCRHLKDGGFLFITDTFKQDYRDRTTYVKFRSLEAYRKILNKERVEIISIVPMYSILGWPYTGNPRLDKHLTFLYSLATSFYEKSELCVKFAYYIDSLLTQFRAFGVSTKLLIGRRG